MLYLFLLYDYGFFLHDYRKSKQGISDSLKKYSHEKKAMTYHCV